MNAELLKQISQAVNVFLDEINLQGKADDVIGLTFSEFGRRIASNLSNGTDHGEAFPMMLFGNRINPVIWGENPAIPEEVKSSANLPMKIDFRSVYASILHHWFNLSAIEIKEILFNEFEILPILKSTVGNDNQVINKHELAITAVYPNPLSQNAEVRFYSTGGKITIQLINSEGKMARMLLDGHSLSGSHTIQFSRNQLPSGQYFMVIQNKTERNTFPIIIE